MRRYPPPRSVPGEVWVMALRAATWEARGGPAEDERQAQRRVRVPCPRFVGRLFGILRQIRHSCRAPYQWHWSR
eukprot:9477807-Pyramimonas_sp.AAC.1